MQTRVVQSLSFVFACSSFVHLSGLALGQTADVPRNANPSLLLKVLNVRSHTLIVQTERTICLQSMRTP
jgi:hypothetical protein